MWQVPPPRSSLPIAAGPTSIPILHCRRMDTATLRHAVCTSQADLRLEFARLLHQLSYLTDRFADKPQAQAWQFVIWLRQGSLFVIAAVAEASLESAVTEGEERSIKDRAVLWVHAALAVLVLLMGWLVHACVEPYEYRFQNTIETVRLAAPDPTPLTARPPTARSPTARSPPTTQPQRPAECPAERPPPALVTVALPVQHPRHPLRTALHLPQHLQPVAHLPAGGGVPDGHHPCPRLRRVRSLARVRLVRLQAAGGAVSQSRQPQRRQPQRRRQGRVLAEGPRGSVQERLVWRRVRRPKADRATRPPKGSPSRAALWQWDGIRAWRGPWRLGKRWRLLALHQAQKAKERRRVRRRRRPPPSPLPRPIRQQLPRAIG